MRKLKIKFPRLCYYQDFKDQMLWYSLPSSEKHELDNRLD